MVDSVLCGDDSLEVDVMKKKRVPTGELKH
jgi:hypothetical protein